jgi:hypothetical protein
MSDSKQKIETILKIDNLRIMKETCLQKGENNEALVIGKQIVNVALNADMNSLALEEREKLAELKQKMERDKKLQQIRKQCEGIDGEFNYLISMGNVLHAHNLVQQFLKLNEEVDDLDSIDEIQELIKKDRKEWVNYKAQNNI